MIRHQPDRAGSRGYPPFRSGEAHGEEIRQLAPGQVDPGDGGRLGAHRHPQAAETRGQSRQRLSRYSDGQNLPGRCIDAVNGVRAGAPDPYGVVGRGHPVRRAPQANRGRGLQVRDIPPPRGIQGRALMLSVPGPCPTHTDQAREYPFEAPRVCLEQARLREFARQLLIESAGSGVLPAS